MNTQPSTFFSKTKQLLQEILNFFSRNPQNRDELIDVLRNAEQSDILDTDSLSIIEGGMQVSDMQVREVMIPKTQAVLLNITNTLEEILPVIIDSAHSRFPVLNDQQNEVVGILLAKDLLPVVTKNKSSNLNMKDLLRPATFIPESKRLNVLLKDFRNNHNHMAIVIDEYGSISGLVTIEDVLEQIVGDIEDEHDVEDEGNIKKIKDAYMIKPTTLIEDFNEYFSTKFSNQEFDTISGIVIQGFGRVPQRNETISISNFEFTVLNADKRRIKLLQVKKIKSQKELNQDSDIENSSIS